MSKRAGEFNSGRKVLMRSVSQAGVLKSAEVEAKPEDATPQTLAPTLHSRAVGENSSGLPPPPGTVRLPDPVVRLNADYSALLAAARNWQLPSLNPCWNLPCAPAFRILRLAAIELARLPDPRPLLRLLRSVGAVDRASFCLKLALIRSLPESLRLQLAALEALLLNECAMRKNTQPATLSLASHRAFLALRWCLDFIADQRWEAAGHLVNSVVKEDWHKSLWALHRWKLTPRSDWSGWRKMIEIHPQGLKELTLDPALIIDEEKASVLASCQHLKTLRFAVNTGRNGEPTPDLAWLDRLAQLKRLYLPANVALSQVPAATLSRLALLALTDSSDPLPAQNIPSALQPTAQLQLMLGAGQTLHSWPALQGQLAALSVDKLGLKDSLNLPDSLERLEVRNADVNVKTPLLRLAHLSELILDGKFQQLEFLNTVLADPTCRLRALTMRRLPVGAYLYRLLAALASNCSLQELHLENRGGLSAKNEKIIPTLSDLIRTHPRLQKLSLRLGPLYTNNVAVEPVLNAIRANHRLLWVKIDLVKAESLSQQEEGELFKRLQALMPASRGLLRFEYSLGSRREQLGNWRY